MIKQSLILQAIENILNEKTSGYKIERNTARNTSMDVAGKDNGWIGIRKGDMKCRPVGAPRWGVEAGPVVEVQYASTGDAAEAEDKLEDSVNEVLLILKANPTLNGTVLACVGYDINYEENLDFDGFFQAAIITIYTESRA